MLTLAADLSGASLPASLQVERRESEEEESGRGERLEAREQVEEEEEEARVGSSSEDGMHSHVSRSENLEQLSISRTLPETQTGSKVSLQQQHTADAGLTPPPATRGSWPRLASHNPPHHLSSPGPGTSSFSSAAWKTQDVLESRAASNTQG